MYAYRHVDSGLWALVAKLMLPADQLRDPKVEDDEATVTHKAQILWLDVTVEEAICGKAVIVQVAQRDSELEGELQRAQVRPPREG